MNQQTPLESSVIEAKRPNKLEVQKYRGDIYSALTLPIFIYKSRDLLNKATDFINCLFDAYEELLFVRADLRYHSVFAECIRIETVQSHREKLLADRRNNPKLFRGFVGCIWALEYGEQSSGYHYHLLLIYDARIRSNSMQISNQISDIWTYKITKGEGWCYLSNRDENKFSARGELGIGLIGRHDTNLRINLIERVIAYLVKKSCIIEERSELTTSGRVRTFGCSFPPVVVG
jgi:hypothetical protein